MNFQHPQLAAGRWFSLSLAEQLGNIGSEVERAIRWHDKGNDLYFQAAFTRMLELLDLTVMDERWKGPRRKELLRVREALCDSFEKSEAFKIPLSDWPRYFFPFAILARRFPSAKG